MLAAGGALFVIRHPGAQPVQPQQATSAVPVSTVKVERQDVPLWLRGIGTVQALNSVPCVPGSMAR